MHIGAGKKGERCGRMGVNEGKGTLSKAGKAHKRKELWQQVKRHRVLYLFALPCVIWLLVFCYAPMAGIVLAFKNYRFDLGIFGTWSIRTGRVRRNHQSILPWTQSGTV